jgi:hypothetical protein
VNKVSADLVWIDHLVEVAVSLRCTASTILRAHKRDHLVRHQKSCAEPPTISKDQREISSTLPNLPRFLGRANPC